MKRTQLSRSTREVLSRGYRQADHLRAERVALERSLRNPDNTRRHEDARTLELIEFHQKILRATITALAGSAE